MRDYKTETQKRVNFIKGVLEDAGAKGVIFGNSGGKDSALVGILAKMACENTVGVLLPCQAKRNFEIDTTDALDLAQQFKIETLTVDLTQTKQALLKAISPTGDIDKMADANIAPRLRMTTLYTIAQTRGLLVAGTGNKSEGYMGYFTKWGDGGYDFNPIADLTVSEVYEFLAYLDAPMSICSKEPSAGLYEGQTDEKEMGVSYAEIDQLLLTGKTGPNIETIERYHRTSAHKRTMPKVYGRVES